MCYPNNGECLARKRQVSIFKVIGFARPGSKSPNLPKRETDALLIRPSHLIEEGRGVHPHGWLTIGPHSLLPVHGIFPTQTHYT